MSHPAQHRHHLGRVRDPDAHGGVAGLSDGARSVRLARPGIVEPHDGDVVERWHQPVRLVDQHPRASTEERVLEQAVVRPQVVIAEHGQLDRRRHRGDPRLQLARVRGCRLKEGVVTAQDQHVRTRRRHARERVVEERRRRPGANVEIRSEHDPQLARGRPGRRRTAGVRRVGAASASAPLASGQRRELVLDQVHRHA